MEEEISLTKRFFIKLFIFFFTALGTYTLSAELLNNSVLSSAIIGFLVSFIPNLFSVKKSQLQAIGFSGSFAGMCSADLILNEFHFLIMSSIGAVLFIFLSEKYQGLGGKLGMIAFVSVFISLFLSGVYF